MGSKARCPSGKTLRDAAGAGRAFGRGVKGGGVYTARSVPSPLELLFPWKHCGVSVSASACGVLGRESASQSVRTCFAGPSNIQVSCFLGSPSKRHCQVR